MLTVRGRLPTVPRTYDGQRRMAASQLRFWSLCTGESRVTVRTPDCVADRELPVDAARRFTVVVSQRRGPPRQRHRALRGVAGSIGATAATARATPTTRVLILRNMLPAAGFAQAVQRVRRPGTEPR